MEYFPESRTVLKVLDLPEDIPDSWRARNRGVARRQITSCTACGLSCGMPRGPVPFQGPSEPSFLAIGEGPGSDEARQLQPFVGRSGKLLRAMLGRTGIEPETVLWANVVSCWPKTGEGKGIKTRTPNNAEMQACRDNLLSQLALAVNPFVLCVGGTALNAMRPDLKVSRIHGRLFLWTVEIPLDGYIETPVSFWVFPILHPAAILRQQVFKEVTQLELWKWKEIIEGSVNPLEALYDTCVVCDKSLTHMDPDGIGYCDQHWARYGNNWRLAREAWRKKPDAPAQDSLL